MPYFNKVFYVIILNHCVHILLFDELGQCVQTQPPGK